MLNEWLLRASIAASTTTRTRWRWSRPSSPRSRPSTTTRLDITDDRHREIFAHRMIAKLPTIAAAAYKHALGQPFLYPRNDLDYTANIAAHVLRGALRAATRSTRCTSKALDLLFILHADHEQNASTSTVRLVGFDGLQSVHRDVGRRLARSGARRTAAPTRPSSTCSRRSATRTTSTSSVERAKDKKDGVRLMGFGHRVYKNFDPRATIIREMCHKVLGKLGQSDNPLFELALRLEEVALKDDVLHRAASSTRTSISTRASSTARSASRARCSR